MILRNQQIALYARVSSDRQRDEHTIESQLDAIAERLTVDGIRMEEAVQFVDDGYSGKFLQRPELDRLRDQIAWGAIQRLYVFRPDRLARKYAYQVVLVEEFQRNNVEVVFVCGSLGDSPEEALFLQLQGMISEYERAKIIEQTRRGRRYAAKRGDVSAFSRAMYGYDYITKTHGGGQARWEVVAEEADVMRRIYEWIGCERVSLREAARRLAGQGILSPEGKKQWNSSTISQMLKNPAYRGQAAYGKRRSAEWQQPLRPRHGTTEFPKRISRLEPVPEAEWVWVPVPALVSEELWMDTNEQLAENAKRNRQHKSGPKYLLQGLTVCGRCGYAYCGRPGPWRKDGGRYVYYRCQGSDKSRFGGEAVCPNRTVPLEALDEAVWSDVRALLEAPEVLEEEYARRLRNERPEGERENRLRSKRMSALQGTLDRLIDAYAAGLLEKNQFEPRLEETKRRLQQLSEEQASAQRRQQSEAELRLIMEHLQAFMEMVKDGLDQADWQTRQAIIRTLVKRIEIHDEDIRLVYRVTPPDPLQNTQSEISRYCSTHPPPACG
jgi:site-specific DNA recombinase